MTIHAYEVDILRVSWESKGKQHNTWDDWSFYYDDQTSDMYSLEILYETKERNACFKGNVRKRKFEKSPCDQKQSCAFYALCYLNDKQDITEIPIEKVFRISFPNGNCCEGEADISRVKVFENAHTFQSFIDELNWKDGHPTTRSSSSTKRND